MCDKSHAKSLVALTDAPEDPLEQALAGALAYACDDDNSHDHAPNLSLQPPIQAIKHLYVACSGGRDSLALAYACHHLYVCGALPHLPTLLHVNHQLQSTAHAWAQGVRAFAHKYGMPCQVLSVTPMNESENAARDARYQALFSAMTDGGVLLLAHHSDDQAETLLMRLINGAGLTGLSAMQMCQTRSHQKKTLTLLRPWLDYTRDDISAYAKRYVLPYVDDPTNEQGDNLRAILRRQVLPSLRAINPKATTNIARSAALLNDARALIDVQVSAQLKALSLYHTSVVSLLDISQLKSLHSAMQANVLRAFIQGDVPYACSYAQTQAVLAMCMRPDNNHHSRIFWQPIAGRVVCLCAYAGLLYRYDGDFWQWLTTAEMTALTWRCLDGDWQLAPSLNAGITTRAPKAWRWRLDVPADKVLEIVPLSRDTRIAFGQGHKSGKKLYQALGIAPWLRDWLWVVVLSDGRRLLVGLYATWQLWTDKRPTPIAPVLKII